MASSGFKIKVGLDSTAAERGLANIGRHANKLNRSMGRLAGKGLKLATGIGAATAAMAFFAGIKFIKDSSKAAADYEKMALGFKGFLGSAEKAAERMRAIEKMSMATPFEPKELAAASKRLQAMGGDTAAIGEGLEMVGDAAAMTGESLDVIARNVGLLFQGLTAGGEVGEATNMLQQTVKGFAAVKGEITDTVAAMRKGDRAFMSSAEALKLIQKGFVETKGGMADLANSFGGRVSTMLGHLDLLRIAFGTGINRGLAEGVNAMNQKIPEMMAGAKNLGDAIGLGLGEAFQGNTRLLELQVSFVFAKLAEIGSAIFLKTTSTLIAHGMTQIIPKLLGQDRASLREFGYTDEELDKGVVMGEGFLAKRMMQESRDFDWKAAFAGTQGIAGSEEIQTEMLAVLKQIRDERLKDAPGWLKAWGGPMLEDHWLDLNYK